tara:strand:- start:244 stop:582 length:339 start_codon:yes stop_codon:yes gene_type:complete
MKNLAQVLVLSTYCLLSACASNSYSELYDFYPVETKTDSKRFSYEFILGSGSRADGSRDAPPRGFVVSFNDMREELEKYMEENPYCTQGYFVYDEIFDGNKYTLLGECQESK